jgi:surface carbohydrate biosynthesis protein
MKLASLPAALKYFWKCKKVIKKPSKADILIYDKEGSIDFFDYLRKYSLSIFECRGESINLLVLLYALYKHGRKVNMEKYASCYITAVNPVAVVTFIDNNKTFYNLKKFHPDVKFISVQNGFRDRCLFDTLKQGNSGERDLFADAIFCFGPAIARYYENAISANVIPHGSLKNNKVEKNHNLPSSRELVFLSQYRPPVFHNGIPTMPVGSRNILWSDFYSVEFLILPRLLDFCKRRNIILKICGTSFNENNGEFEFFAGLLGDGGWEYWKKGEDLDNYRKIDQASAIVFIDSTLGYEALGRGLKCIAFPLRGEVLQVDDRSFGWPADLPESGPFWTSQGNESEVERLMSYITMVSDDEWKLVSTPVVEQLMHFDQGNSRFIELIDNFVVKKELGYA